MAASSIDVAIIGAGPYGLSLATYLQARGIEHRIFGSPMHTWRNMAAGMCLKSLGFATNIPTPQGRPTLPEYCRERGLEDYEPIEMATFARYGLWVQRQLVPYLEETTVVRLSRATDGFQLQLETGEQVRARRVVVAIGLTYFQFLPEVLASLPPDRVSHTVQHRAFDAFAGAKVLVVGAGSSALEAAALLHEAGADVQMVVRGQVHWGLRGPKDTERSLLERIRLPNSVLGHGRENWVLQHFPMLMHYLPAAWRLRFTRSHLGPSGAWWLRERVEGKFPIHTGMTITGASVRNGKACLHLRGEGGVEREATADHVVAGTGYRVDVDRVAFLDRSLAGAIRRYEAAPRLSRHFETSVPGLYFVGPSAAASFGPLVRFVAGAAFAVPVVARHLARGAPARGRVRYGTVSAPLRSGEGVRTQPGA